MGDDLAAEGPARGLPLSERCGGAGPALLGAAACLWALGEVPVGAGGGGRSEEEKEGLSWGAGEGAMAIAALILEALVKEEQRVVRATRCFRPHYTGRKGLMPSRASSSAALPERCAPWRLAERKRE